MVPLLMVPLSFMVPDRVSVTLHVCLKGIEQIRAAFVQVFVAKTLHHSREHSPRGAEELKNCSARCRALLSNEGWTGLCPNGSCQNPEA
jgi:hypothetical protein